MSARDAFHAQETCPKWSAKWVERTARLRLDYCDGSSMSLVVLRMTFIFVSSRRGQSTTISDSKLQTASMIAQNSVGRVCHTKPAGLSARV